MKHGILSRWVRWLVVAFAGGSLAAAVVAADAADAEDADAVTAYGKKVATVVVPPGLGEELVRRTAIRAFAGRAWELKEAKKDRVVGYLKHRGYEATLTMVLGKQEIVFYCEGWRVDRDGNRESPKQPEGWIENLRRDMTKLLGRAAAETL